MKKFSTSRVVQASESLAHPKLQRDKAPVHKGDAGSIAEQFRRTANRFYLANLLVLGSLAAVLYAGWRHGWYREAFFVTTALFLLWLFNAGRLLRCPACGARLRSKEGLIRMPAGCTSCGARLR